MSKKVGRRWAKWAKNGQKTHFLAFLLESYSNPIPSTVRKKWAEPSFCIKKWAEKMKKE